MSVQNDAPYTIIGPDGTQALINQDPALAAHVGLVDAEVGVGGFDCAEVRESAEDLPEGDGGMHGPFFYGRRVYTIPVIFLPDPGANLNAQIDRLNRVTNAMTTDGTVLWTETGRPETRFLFRRQLPYRVTGARPKRALLGLVSEDPYPLSSAESSQTVTTNTSVTNAGTAPTLPRFVLTAPQNTITLTRSSPAPSAVMTLTGLSGAGTVTIDFAAKTVTATIGASDRIAAVNFPSSIWWELLPGVNVVSVAGATATSGLKWRDAWL